MASVTPIRELRRKADGEPRQDIFWREADIIPEYWAWVVFIRIACEVPDANAWEWSEWVPCYEKPNHFRSEAGAEQALAAFRAKEKRKHDLALIESKVEPKYIGCARQG